jgi:hypothetical protein
MMIFIKSSSALAEENSQEPFVPSQCAGSYHYRTEWDGFSPFKEEPLFSPLIHDFPFLCCNYLGSNIFWKF